MVNVISTLRSNTKPILGEQPSIFEVQYPSTLSSSLYNASKFTAKILALIKGGPKYVALNSNFDKFYLTFNTLLNFYYLKQYGSSFFEYFYGIKRVVKKTGTVPRNNIEVFRSLLQIVFLPYLKEKLVEWKNKLSEESAVIQSKWKFLFLKAWPYIIKLIYILSIILQAMYLFGYAPVHNIEMILAGVYYQKFSPLDLKIMESRKIIFDSSTIFGRIFNFIVGLFSKFGKILSFVLIGIQVLQYIQESSDSSTSNILNIFGKTTLGERKSDIEFPVKKLTEAEALNLSNDQCPLCLGKRENDTVLSSSGYIFCFKCIRQYISKFGRCPVTSTPATLNQLVRLYG